MRIGTRASALALAQAKSVAELLADAEIHPMLTSGDRGARVQDKSRWVLELENALRTGEIDVAVHSAKDVPCEPAEGLALVAAPRRAAAEDVLCGAGSLAELPAGAKVGTSSARRAAQLRAWRADLEVVPARGNVDTRLDKLQRGEFDAIVLARAGLQRLARDDAAGGTLDPAQFVPAPGQGTLALQARSGDARVREALTPISDAGAFECLLAERALARALGADCHTPLGAHAVRVAGQLHVRAWVGLPDGSTWVSDELLGDEASPEELGRELATRLELVGAGEILARAREMALAQTR